MTTKERILEATLELASSQGLGSVSLSQIAKVVGIQKQSIYNHFPSKEAVLEELYEYLRQKARDTINHEPIDYGSLVKGKTPLEILSTAVQSYMEMNNVSQMEQLYKFVMSERVFQKEAAKIMVAETEKMIVVTKQLFYAMQVQNVMQFENVDMAAFSFAMTVHSIMDYIADQKVAGVETTAEQLLQEYLEDFCKVYGVCNQ